jgi:hypothetical protein
MAQTLTIVNTGDHHRNQRRGLQPSLPGERAQPDAWYDRAWHGVLVPEYQQRGVLRLTPAERQGSKADNQRISR